MRNRYARALTILIPCLIIAFYTGGCKVESPAQPPAEGEEMLDTDGDIETAAPPWEGPYSPYTGLPAPEVFSNPYAIIIENSPQARPQAGISKAELVYEVPVEGGITRFLALFSTPLDVDIGPVRSARPYFAYLAKEHDGILAHCGHSIHTKNVFKEIGLKHLDELFNPPYFWRSKTRKAPHNLYTTISHLAEGIDNTGNKQNDSEPAEPFMPFKEREISAQPEAALVTIAFSSNNRVEYRLNESGTYTRYEGGNAFIDDNGKTEVEVCNIIAQYLQGVRIFTGEGHLQMPLTGEGAGYFFSRGQVEEITWQKESLTAKTRFLDKQGNPIALTPGNTWIHLLPQYGEATWQ